MAATQQFVGTIQTAVAQVSTANTNRDGSGTLATVYTAPAGGSRFEQLDLKAAGGTSAGMVRMYRSIDGGTTKRLWREFVVQAITVGADVGGWELNVSDLGLTMENAEVLYASTHVGETINLVLSKGGDL